MRVQFVELGTHSILSLPFQFLEKEDKCHINY